MTSIVHESTGMQALVEAYVQAKGARHFSSEKMEIAVAMLSEVKDKIDRIQRLLDEEILRV